MKPIAILAAAVLAACGCAAELSPKLLGLIGTDVTTVAGADLVRQGNSALHQFFQSSVVPGVDARASYQVLWIERNSADGPDTLTVVTGPIPPNAPNSSEEFTVLDANIRVAGAPDNIQDAQRNWTIEQPLSPIAAKVRPLAQSYDNWFLMTKPFARLSPVVPAVSGSAASLLKDKQDLIEAVEELSGGVRFGAINELNLEVVFRNPEDAWAVATLARWLPGILQLQPDNSSTGILADAIEDFTVQVQGQRVSLSLRIPEEKARSLSEPRKPHFVVE
jgi:hypothetical protein